ncbi:hypothetical protein HMPREF3050_06235 [Neisseria sp. HMSC065D04]|nr:hypothetical protein HMPREF3050_06235 [Neisseria sp. HMSC065D04]OFT27513.1 hypothetical protein HMPREF3066_00545 [Neisseria sp. HMSC03D10]OHR71853.1 hypothetical protein HMPREF3277_12090 [Neisseria sp. HMSC70E02]
MPASSVKIRRISKHTAKAVSKMPARLSDFAGICYTRAMFGREKARQQNARFQTTFFLIQYAWILYILI